MQSFAEMGRKVLIKDIAEKLGVSNATVSIVLNGKEGRVGKELSKRILETAKDLNYKPNNLARGLRMGKSRTIGLIVADITNGFFANLAFQIQEYAESLNYAVIIANTNESVDKMDKMIDVLKSRQVDGYVIVPTEFGEESIKRLVDNEVPVVLMDRYFPGIEASYVSVNNYDASKQITQYLIDSGCKKIALISYNNTLTHMQERKRGYIDALKEAGLYNADLIKSINYENMQEEVVKAVEELIAEKGKKIGGIFFATNSLSTVGMRHLLKLKVNIPDQVKVASFDRSDVFDFFNVKIPHVRQPIPEMGRRAVDLLLQQVERGYGGSVKSELLAEVCLS